MSITSEIMAEVLRRQDETGQVPVKIMLNPIMKAQWESELKGRKSFADGLTKGKDMVINRIFEPITEGAFRGHPKPNGWEIAVEAKNDVPLGQIWVAVNGYSISRQRLSGEIQERILKGRSIT